MNKTAAMKTLLTALFINLFICSKDDKGILCYDARNRTIEANGKGELRIYDIYGRLIHAQKIQDTEGVLLDIESNPKGIYIATLRENKIKFVNN